MPTFTKAKQLIKLCVLFIFYASSVFAQKYSFINYSIKEGLPHASVNVIFQDSRGYIWIGTNGGGLSKYDGYTFVNYNRSNGLNGNVIYSISEDAKGNIWLVTENAINAFNGITLKSLGFNKLNHKIQKLCTDSIKNIWSVSPDGLYWEFNYAADSISFICKKIMPDYLKNTGEISSFSTDSYNRLWISSDSVIYVLNPGKEYLPDTLQLNQAIPKDIITSIQPAKEGEMWIGTKNNGIFLIKYGDDYSYLKRSYNSYFDNIDDYITDIFTDSKGKTWCGTNNGGIVFIDFPFLKILNPQQGLESNQITNITEDSEGNIWIASRNNGIQRFQGWQFTHNDDDSGIPVKSINDITQDKSGNYWISSGTNLYRIKKRNDQLRVFNVLLPEEYASTEFNTILIPNDNLYFFGTNNNGLLILQNNELLHLTLTNVLPDNKVNAILPQDSLTVWVGTDNGLVKTKINATGSKNYLSGKEVYSLAFDNNKNVWAGTNKGLYKTEENEVVEFNENNGLNHLRINSILFNDSNNLIIGTMGGGIYLLKPDPDNVKEPKIIQWISPDLLVSPNIYSLLKINDSVLIAGADKGFNKINIAVNDSFNIKSIQHYTPYNGFINAECNLNAIFLDNQKDAWFGTKSGLTLFNSKKAHSNNQKPRIYFNKLKVNTEPVNWEEKTQKTPAWKGFGKALKFKHRENYIDFSFYGIYYSEELLYQYILEGQDKTWSKPSSGLTAGYSKLNPGKYTFKVKALTQSGLESEPITYSFIIKPPFWKTWWFILIIVISAILGIFFFIKYREQKLIRDKEILEDIVEKRTEEIQKQKTEIEQQKKSLTDSITYAKRIQDAVISKPETIEEHISDYFIVYLPKDIVSGDFYWFGQIEDNIVFLVADCTGHGVPGAFMSMLGIRLLNEIILERKIKEPHKILNQLRSSIIESLNQGEKESSTKDGMDMSLCSLNLKTKQLQYAGAYNPMWVIRNGELLEFKADRMPIAIFQKMHDFNTTPVDCKRGDIIYLFSDGLPDQFGGGEEAKKFKIKQLRELILSIWQKPLQEQREIILEKFYKWKGNHEQIDDVSLIGIKVE